MSDMLVRGVPPKVRREIQRLVNKENLSMNQAVIRLLMEAVHAREKQNGAEDRQKDVFRRIDELREEIYKKRGLMDDSTKLIREDRESH